MTSKQHAGLWAAGLGANLALVVSLVGPIVLVANARTITVSPAIMSEIGPPERVMVRVAGGLNTGPCEFKLGPRFGNSLSVGVLNRDRD